MTNSVKNSLGNISKKMEKLKNIDDFFLRLIQIRKLFLEINRRQQFILYYTNGLSFLQTSYHKTFFILNEIKHHTTTIQNREYYEKYIKLLNTTFKKNQHNYHKIIFSFYNILSRVTCYDCACHIMTYLISSKY